MGLVSVENGDAAPEGPIHEHRNPPGRSDAAGPSPAGARAAARAGDVCRGASLVQCIGFPGVGIRLPVMMGVTFASVGPMLSMAAAPDIGLLGIYGSVIAAGIFGILAAPFISRLLPLFPPVVTGTIILVIGISLMRVGINWAGGGLPTLTKLVDGVPGAFPNPGYGQLQGLGIALFVLLVILGLIKWGTGFITNVSVLLGIIAGAILATLLGG